MNSSTEQIPRSPQAANEEGQAPIDPIDKLKPFVETDVSKMGFWDKIGNQEIPHILVTPTFSCAMACFAVLVAIFGGFGAICLVSAMGNHDMLVRYDE